MMSLKQLSTLTLAAVGLAATQSQACHPATKSEPANPQASERGSFVASLASPAGAALLGTAGLVGVGRARSAWKRSLVVGTAKDTTRPGTTAAFDYPGGEEW